MASLNFRKDNKAAYITIYSGEIDINGKPERLRFTIKNENELPADEFKIFAKKQAEDEEKRIKETKTMGGHTLLKVFAKQYFKNAVDELKPTTLSGKIQDYNNFVLPRFGDKKLKDISTAEIQRWINQLQKEKSYSYMCRIFFVLVGILKEASRLNLVDDVVTDNVILKKTKKQRDSEKTVKAFTPEEIEYYKQKINEIPNRMVQCVFYLAIYTGLRIGEILGLTWDCVDFEKQELLINKNRVFVGGFGWTTNEPKTKSGTRKVWLPEKIIPLLKDWQHEQELMRKLNKIELIHDNEFGELDLVATNTLGQTASRENFNRYLRNWNKERNDEEKIKAKEEGRAPELWGYKSFHSFRHYYASYLVNNNVNLVVARDLLGHQDVRTTFQTYADSFNEKTREELSKLFKD